MYDSECTFDNLEYLNIMNEIKHQLKAINFCLFYLTSGKHACSSGKAITQAEGHVPKL